MNLWKVLSLSCHEASHLASDGRDRELTKLERYALRAHLVGCNRCKRYQRHLESIGDALKDESKLSDEARERIRANLAPPQPPSEQ